MADDRLGSCYNDHLSRQIIQIPRRVEFLGEHLKGESISGEGGIQPKALEGFLHSGCEGDRGINVELRVIHQL